MIFNDIDLRPHSFQCSGRHAQSSPLITSVAKPHKVLTSVPKSSASNPYPSIWGLVTQQKIKHFGYNPGWNKPTITRPCKAKLRQCQAIPTGSQQQIRFLLPSNQALWWELAQFPQRLICNGLDQGVVPQADLGLCSHRVGGQVGAKIHSSLDFLLFFAFLWSFTFLRLVFALLRLWDIPFFGVETFHLNVGMLGMWIMLSGHGGEENNFIKSKPNQNNNFLKWPVPNPKAPKSFSFFERPKGPFGPVHMWFQPLFSL